MKREALRKQLSVVALLLLLTPLTELQARTSSWLRGTWAGAGYQTDTESTWPMTLTVRNGPRRRLYLVDYPSLKCGGRWKPLGTGKRRATFTEVLTHGQADCLDNGRVIIQRISSTQLLYLYSNQGSKKITASAILNRRRMAANN